MSSRSGPVQPDPEESAAPRESTPGFIVSVLRRWAHNRPERLPELAADLVRHRAAVIATNGGAPIVRVVKAASASVAIVFLVDGDPAQAGIVESLARPGGSATGVYMLTSSLNGKRLQLLHDMVPQVKTMAVLINPATPGAKGIEAEVGLTIPQSLLLLADEVIG
jgi:ABC-type uncharacterized transport system substrate-binding protein